MHYKTAYKKFKNAKVDALSNSTNIQVGRLELNKALKALENMEKLADIYERQQEKTLKELHIALFMQTASMGRL